MKINWRLLVAAIGVGAIMAVIYKVFEVIVNDGQNWIWNDLGHSDSTRWLVVPLAVGLSLVFGLVLVARKAPRWIDPETDLFTDTAALAKKTTLMDVFWGLAIGASSLLAGAPLGPEMPLTESSLGMGKWTSAKFKLEPAAAAILVATSIGALMVAFLGSMWMAALPFLLVFKKDKSRLKSAALPIILGCLSAFGTLWLMDHNTAGYGAIPVGPHANFNDYWGTIVAAFIISIFAILLLRLLKRLAKLTKQWNAEWRWYLGAAVFGLVLGLLYWLGGQTVEFSGSAGTKLLVETSKNYGTWALLGLAAVKLVAVVWTKATGYRGGLYFPSIFASVAIALFIESLFGLNGPSILIGAVAAIFAALGFPDEPNAKPKDYAVAMIMAFLIILALVPFSLFFLALLAVAAAAASNMAIFKLAPIKQR